MLAKVGYGKEAAGGLLAAGGLGAIISPPVLGAAAFLIAEFLKISYLDVILMATIPTCLYYLALFAMVEIDVRKFGMKDVTFERVESAWNLTRKYWFHFLSLVSTIPLNSAIELSPTRTARPFTMPTMEPSVMNVWYSFPRSIIRSATCCSRERAMRFALSTCFAVTRGEASSWAMSPA